MQNYPQITPILLSDRLDSVMFAEESVIYLELVL